MIMKLIEIMIQEANCEICKQFVIFNIHNVSFVSSVSARKLKCPSSDWIGSARAGKFQLELITTKYVLVAKLFKAPLLGF